MSSVNLIPSFVKSFYSEEDIKPVSPNWRRPAGYDLVFYLNTYNNQSIFIKCIETITKYLDIGQSIIQSEILATENHAELLVAKGVLDVPHVIKASQYGTSILFNDKEFAIKFISKLNLWLEYEYQELEAKLKVAIILEGENIKDYEASNVIVTSKDLLKHFVSEFDAKYFFRTLQIVSIKKESAYAIEAYIKFYTEVCGQCHLCGRPLEDEFSQKTGIGPVCAKKKLGIKRTNIEDIEAVSNKIKAIAEKIGTIGPVIIPKSQIHRLK